MSEGEKLTAVKLLAMIGFLYLLRDAFTYFYGASVAGNEILALYGILELVFAIVIFLGLNYWELIPISLPFTWWILLIIGVLTIIFGFLASTLSYFTGALITIAALIDLIGDKKAWKASKIMACLGAAFGIFNCIIIFMGAGNVPAPTNTQVILNGVFGLILAIILIIIIFDLVDIKIPYEWWVLLIIGFVFFTWVDASAAISAAVITFTNLDIALAVIAMTTWCGLFLLIAFLLLILDF